MTRRAAPPTSPLPPPAPPATLRSLWKPIGLLVLVALAYLGAGFSFITHGPSFLAAAVFLAMKLAIALTLRHIAQALGWE